MVGNVSKLIDMIETGKKSEIENFPTNAGAIVGNGIDQIAGSKGKAQGVLGITNDIGSAFISPVSDYKILNIADESLNSYKSPNAWRGIYEDGHSIYESFK